MMKSIEEGVGRQQRVHSVLVVLQSMIAQHLHSEHEWALHAERSHEASSTPAHLPHDLLHHALLLQHRHLPPPLGQHAHLLLLCRREC